LTDILHSLRAYQLPEGVTLPQLGNVSLKFGAVEMFFEHPIIPAMQYNTVIVDHPSGVD